MRVMITGIAGFIGFHTALKFKSLGHDVYGIDNFNEYYDPLLKEHRKAILHAETIDVYRLDIKDNYALYDLINDRGIPDLVIHLAASAGVRHSMIDPSLYYRNNILGTQSLIGELEVLGVQNVIYASTSCVLHSHDIPWKEEDYLYPQKNPYGLSKMANESQFNMSNIRNAVCMRFFTVYGPYGRPDMALFDFTKDILAGNPITVYNNGDMKRDFTYIDDIVQGIVIVSLNMSERETYNIGRGEQVQLMRFVRAIEKSLGIEAEINYGPMHPAEVKETWCDTSKLKKLGYNPKTSIEEGVERFIEWYRWYGAYHNKG